MTYLFSRNYVNKNFRNHPTSQVLVRGEEGEVGGRETREFTAPETVIKEPFMIGELEASSDPRWNAILRITLCKRGLS